MLPPIEQAPYTNMVPLSDVIAPVDFEQDDSYTTNIVPLSDVIAPIEEDKPYTTDVVPVSDALAMSISPEQSDIEVDEFYTTSMLPLSDVIAPVAMAITPEQSDIEVDDDDDIDFKVWTPGDLISAPIPAEIDENKIQVTDDGDVILTEPDNMDVEQKPFDITFEGVVALPPEESMEVVRTKNLVLKRKQPNNRLANIKKIKNETDVRVRDVVPKTEDT